MIVLMVVAATTLAFAQTGGPKSGLPGGQGKGGQQGQKQQGGRGFGGGGGMRMMQDPKMAAKYKEIQTAAYKKAGLSAAQITQVEAANKKNMDAMKNMMPKPGGTPPSDKDREAMRTKFQTARKNHEAALTKIMTAPKYKIYQDAMKAGMEKLRSSMPKGGPGGAPPAGGKGKGKGGGL